MKVKVKVTARAWYKNTYLKEGQIIDFNGDKMPSWATLADGIEVKSKKQEQKKESNPVNTETLNNENTEENGTGVELDNTPEETEVVVAGDGGVHVVSNEENQEENNSVNSGDVSAEALEYLERLINEGIEKDILIEDADKKTVQEQIKELEEKLGKGKNPCA